MAENNKKRNSIVTIFLWLSILGYMAIMVSYMVTMFSSKMPNTVLGLGLCSMLALADALGLLLMMRWVKNGFYLLVLSSVLSSVVNLSVLKLNLLPSVTPLIASAIWFAILQLRFGGKSVWSQLRSGWDSKHCRHIYQMIAAIEIILFVLTLITFGNCKEDKVVSPVQINEPEKVEPEPQTPPHNHIPTKEIDSIQESSPKTPENEELAPIHSERESHQKPEKPSRESAKDSKASNDAKSKSTLYDLNAAAKYLDTHDVWEESEMSKYADLKGLNQHILMSIRRGRLMIPGILRHKSKRLQRLERLLMEHSNLCKSLKRNSHINFKGSMSAINYLELVRSVEVDLKSLQRLKEINKEVEEYHKLISDSIKNTTPSFGLG